MRKTLADPGADPAAREKALTSLLAANDRETLPILLELVKKPGPLRSAAFRGLAAFDDRRGAEAIVSAYPTLTPDERRDALATLLARPVFAQMLVAALDANQVPTGDLSAAQIRQLRGLKDPAVEAWLQEEPSPGTERHGQTGGDRALQTAARKPCRSGDVYRGRALYAQSCAICHRLFEAGGDVGPELTGANRTDVDYLLQNILDPNALIGKDYQSTTIETKDGRIIVGIVRADNEQAIELKTLTGPVTVPRADVKSVVVSEVSMMPEGLLAGLDPAQVADLFAYLGSQQQVPMAVTAMNSLDFFNGRDLSRWQKSSDAWSFADGIMRVRGNAQRPEKLVSEMIAGDFKLTGQLQIIGENAAAEIVLRGRITDQEFGGFSVSLGGPTPSNLWIYLIGKPQPALTGPVLPPARWIPFEIEGRGSKVRVAFDGQEAFAFNAPGREARTTPAFYLLGEGAELQLKDLKIEVAP